MRADIEKVLKDNGLSDNPDNELHSWRCKYPVHGQSPCTCFSVLVDDLVKVSETKISNVLNQDLATQEAKKWLLATGSLTLADAEYFAPGLARDIIKAALV